MTTVLRIAGRIFYNALRHTYLTRQPVLRHWQPRVNFSLSSRISAQQLGTFEGKMSITFTCNVCSKRDTKLMSKRAYEKGVVLITCDGCKNVHLIADNLKWFADEKRNIEDILKEKGEKVQRLTSFDDMQFVEQDEKD